MNGKYFHLLITTILVSLLGVSCMDKPVPVTNAKAFIEFDTLEWNFGTFKVNESRSHKFVYHNTGATPLVIHDVATFCGCTTVEWDSIPVMPGHKGNVTVNYKSSSPGHFIKSALILHNGSNNYRIILKVTGETE